MLEILTLNIWHDEENWPARRDAIRVCLDELQPDVIALQEVLQGDDFRQLDDLLQDRLPHRCFGAAKPVSDRPGLQKGVGLAARWPLVSPHTQPLPDAGDSERRVALHARCQCPRGAFHLACTHLNWRLDHGAVRSEQVLALTREVARLADADDPVPPVIAGDFNAEPDSDEIRFMTGLHALQGVTIHYRDAWRMIHGTADGYTWSNRNDHARRALEPQRRLDYVFVGPPRSGRGHVIGCRVVCDQKVGDTWPSDHFGVLATLSSGGT